MRHHVHSEAAYDIDRTVEAEVAKEAELKAKQQPPAPPTAPPVAVPRPEPFPPRPARKTRALKAMEPEVK